MTDPVSWFMIEPAWSVVTSDGKELGNVTEVLGDMTRDIFDGLTVGPGLLKKPKYVPAEHVGTIVEGRVELDLTAAEFEVLAESPPGVDATTH